MIVRDENSLHVPRTLPRSKIRPSAIFPSSYRMPKKRPAVSSRIGSEPLTIFRSTINAPLQSLAVVLIGQPYSGFHEVPSPSGSTYCHRRPLSSLSEHGVAHSFLHRFRMCRCTQITDSACVRVLESNANRDAVRGVVAKSLLSINSHGCATGPTPARKVVCE